MSESYSSVLEQLYSQVRLYPFQTTFHLAMDDEAMANQIGSWFSSQGLKAKVESSGYFRPSWFLEVEIKLPPTLAHKPIPQPPINYMETYVPPCKGLNIASEDF